MEKYSDIPASEIGDPVWEGLTSNFVLDGNKHIVYHDRSGEIFGIEVVDDQGNIIESPYTVGERLDSPVSDKVWEAAEEAVASTLIHRSLDDVDQVRFSVDDVAETRRRGITLKDLDDARGQLLNE